MEYIKTMEALIVPEQFIAQVWCGTKEGQLSFKGTGFFIAPDLLLTCKHVVRFRRLGSTEENFFQQFSIRFYENTHPVECELQWYSDNQDLAILRLTKEVYPERVLTWVTGVRKRTKKAWLTKDWYTSGFPESAYGENIESCRLKKLKEPPSDHADGFPTRIQFKNTISHGCSGSPIVTFSSGQWYCAGIMYLGGPGKRVSEGFTADYLYLLLRPIEREKISVINVSKILEIVPDDKVPVRTSSLFSQAKDRFLGKMIISLKHLGLVMAILILSFMGIWSYLKKYSASKRTIAIFQYSPLDSGPLPKELSDIIREKVQFYVEQQSTTVDYRKKFSIITLPKKAQSLDDVKDYIMKNSGVLAIWGRYAESTNGVTIQTDSTDSLYKNLHLQNTQHLNSMDDALASKLETLVGNRTLALLHLELGMEAQSQGNYFEAANQFAAAEKLDESFTKPNSLFNVSSPCSCLRVAIIQSYSTANNPSAEQLSQMFYMSHSTNDKASMAQYHDLMTCQYLKQNNFIAATQECNQAASEYEKMNDQVGVLSQICRKAQILRNEGRLQEARLEWQNCAEKLEQRGAKDSKSQLICAEAHVQIGRIFIEQHGYDDARAHLNKSFRFISNNITLSEAHYLLAVVDSVVGNFQAALEHNVQAVDLLPQPTSSETLGILYAQRGDIQQKMGNSAQSILDKTISSNAYLNEGYNPSTLRPCMEAAARCEQLSALQEARKSSPSAEIVKLEETMKRRSPCNGITQCMNDILLQTNIQKSCKASGN